MRLAARLAVVCAIASCWSASPTQAPPPPPPPPPVDPGPPAPPPVDNGGFAQPPGGGTAPPTAPATLPTVGPECAQKDCPTTAPLYPTQMCGGSGFIGGRGPCVRFASGCNWSHLVCPSGQTVCTPSSCDLPIPAEWRCPDGKSIGRFECVSTANGKCGTTYQPCPFVAQKPPAPPPPPQPAPQVCPNPLPSDKVLKTWPVGEICAPGGGPAQPRRTFIKALGDGTQIIEQVGRCMRVREVKCYTKCLPPDARIATPSGDIAISALHIGDEVWTQDGNGKRVVGRVEDISSPAVAGEHHVAHLVLADGRSVTVSPEHPALGDLRVEDLRVGDRYDGATIVELTFVRYAGDHTFDIRVSGDTSVYWADAIPLRSTLAN